MSPTVSVIVPTLNAEDDILQCFASISPAHFEGLLAEVIVSDGGSDDDTCLIAESAGATIINSPKGRGTQMAKAAQISKGEWLLFLHADSVFDEDFTGALKTHINNSDKAGYFLHSFDQSGFRAKTVSGWANFRSKYFALPYGDQGLLISKQLYDEINGHPGIPIMEDVAIARKLRGKLQVLDATITTSAEKYVKRGWFRQSLMNFMFLTRYLAGADPNRIAAKYNR